jgi:hypothetical protein
VIGKILIVLTLGWAISESAAQSIGTPNQFFLTLHGGIYQAGDFNVTSVRMNTDENDLTTSVNPLDDGIHTGVHFRIFPHPHWGGGISMGRWSSSEDAHRLNLSEQEERTIDTKIRSIPVLFEGFYRVTAFEPSPLYPYVGIGLGVQSVKWTYDQVDIDLADGDQFDYHVEATASPITIGLLGGLDYVAPSGFVGGVLLSFLSTPDKFLETQEAVFSKNGVINPNGPQMDATVDGGSWPEVGEGIRTFPGGFLEGDFGGLGVDFYIGYKF